MTAAGLSRIDQFLVPRQELRCIYYPRPCRNLKNKSFSRDSRVFRARANAATEEDEQKLREQQHEIRVCINRTCRKSGSLETLEVIRSLAPPNVTVESCSCLEVLIPLVKEVDRGNFIIAFNMGPNDGFHRALTGKCGNGPNLVILPAEMMVSHCNTAAHAARLLALQCGASNPENNLKALGLKQLANKAFERSSLVEAEELYTKAIDLSPSGGLHFIFANRSAVRLAQGNLQGALEDAREAERIAPKWAQAFVRQADAFSAMGEVEPALDALSAALRLDPLLRRSKGFQAKTRDLQSKVATARAS